MAQEKAIAAAKALARKADPKHKTAAPTGAAVFMGAVLRARGAPRRILRRSSILPKAKSRRRADLLRPRISKNGVPASVYAGGAGLPPPWLRRRQSPPPRRWLRKADPKMQNSPPQPGRLFLWGRSSGRGSAPAHLRRSSILPKAKSRLYSAVCLSPQARFGGQPPASNGIKCPGSLAVQGFRQAKRGLLRRAAAAKVTAFLQAVGKVLGLF